jgi:hypothetical protein
MTSTLTPVTERATTVGSGKVWLGLGPNVILTLPNGETWHYKARTGQRFIVEGNKASVLDRERV